MKTWWTPEIIAKLGPLSKPDYQYTRVQYNQILNYSIVKSKTWNFRPIWTQKL